MATGHEQPAAPPAGSGAATWPVLTGAVVTLALGSGGLLGFSAIASLPDAPPPIRATSTLAEASTASQGYSVSSSVAPQVTLSREPGAGASRRDERSTAAGRRPLTTAGQPPDAGGYVTVPQPQPPQGQALLVEPPFEPPGGSPAGSPAGAPAGSPAGSPAAPPAEGASPAEAVSPQEPAVFRLATLNVLGHGHTTPRGNKPGYADGTVRMQRSVQVLTGKGVDLVGFQELEEPQYREFQRITGGSWGVFPAMTMGSNPVRNSIAWRKDTWAVVSSGTIPVPYFHGKRVPMPWVLLEHVATDRRLAVVNVHNPASTKRRGNNERWRDVGTALEVDLVNRLKATSPVVLMGDFNEREEAFCKVTAGAAMRAANGGTSSPCRPPARAGIDWIFGTPELSFSAYERYSSALLRSATDHPLIVATGRLGG